MAYKKLPGGRPIQATTVDTEKSVNSDRLAEPNSERKAGSNRYTKKNDVTVTDIDFAFPEFWSAYPKRVAKAQAEKAFAAAIKRGADPAR